MRRLLILAWTVAVFFVSACGGAPPAAPPDEPPGSDAGTVQPTTYTPDDPRIQYTGRIDFSGPAPRFSAPGVSIKARFSGTSIHLLLRDLAAGDLQKTNYYNVLIDDQPPVRLQVRGAVTEYELASGLGPGEHTVEFFKRTEGNVGASELLGLRVHGTLLEPPARPARRLEFIGDSITCGYGNGVSILPPPLGNPDTGFSAINQDYSQAYGARVARALSAQGVATCQSGRGVYRNADGSTQGTLPQLYRRTLLEQPQYLWDTQRYTPDVIVINLGTNDFIQGVPDSAAFQAAYRSFVSQLRSHYPNARILCVVGPMLNDYYPPGQFQWTRIQQYVRQMVEGLNAQGDERVHYFALTPQPDIYGEDWHPTSAAHEVSANELTAEIRRLTGW